jgi:hypothetical protein
MVSAADKLHNARAVLTDYRELGEGLWPRFKAPKGDQLWFYEEMIKTLRQTAAPKPLVDELSLVVEELNQLAKPLEGGYPMRKSIDKGRP